MQYRDNAFSTLVRISYQPPGFLFYLVTLTHLGAVFSIYYADLPVSPMYAGLFLVVLSYANFLFNFRQARVQQVSPVLCLNKKNEWSVTTQGVTHALQLRPGAYVHPGLVILRFIDQNKKPWCFILTRTNVDEHSFRRLRVRLLHGETSAVN